MATMTILKMIMIIIIIAIALLRERKCSMLISHCCKQNQFSNTINMVTKEDHVIMERVVAKFQKRLL